MASLALSSAACATITRGTSTDWVIDTYPQGARVTTSNGHECAATPCSLRMPRESEFTATVTLAGYETETVAVTHILADTGAAGFAGNVLVGGGIGMVLDSNNGATQDLSPNPVSLTLRPSAPAAAVGGGSALEQQIDSIDPMSERLF